MDEPSSNKGSEGEKQLIRAGEKVEQLYRGDRLVVSTLPADEIGDNAPSWAQNSTVAAAKNPVNNSPYWICVKGGEQGTSYVGEVEIGSKNYVECCIIKKISSEKDETSDWLSHARQERVVWTGSAQSRLEARHNEVMKEGDIRGSRNDLLGGHQ